MWTLHPSSLSSDTATRLCGIVLTLKARLHFIGNFLRRSVKDSDVYIRTLDGVFNDMFGSCIFATSQSASFPKIEVDAAQSKYAVVLFKFGGLVQPGGSS